VNPAPPKDARARASSRRCIHTALPTLLNLVFISVKVRPIVVNHAWFIGYLRRHIQRHRKFLTSKQGTKLPALRQLQHETHITVSNPDFNVNAVHFHQTQCRSQRNNLALDAVKLFFKIAPRRELAESAPLLIDNRAFGAGEFNVLALFISHWQEGHSLFRFWTRHTRISDFWDAQVIIKSAPHVCF
jgi:hypothetical protein